MSNDFISALLASIGYNDGANKGFWRIQPRDDEGQWIEMGASVLFRFRTGAGNLVVATALGIYVGPSGKPGKARVLVAKDNKFGLAPGVHELDSNNLTQIGAYIPEEGVPLSIKANRKDKFGRPVKTLADSKLPTKNDLDATVTAPTKDDERLAKGELTDAERQAEQDGRKNSPIADLPAGFEAENPEEVKNLLRQSGVDPDQFDVSDQDYAAFMDAIDNFGATGPRGVTGGPATNALKDLKSLVGKDSLQELASDIYYNRENTSGQGDLSAAFQDADPANSAYGDGGQNPAWNEAYNKAWDEAVKKIFRDPKVRNLSENPPIGDERTDREPNQDVVNEHLTDLANALGDAIDEATKNVAEEEKKPTPAPAPAPELFDTTGMDAKTIGRLNAALDKKISYNGEITTMRDVIKSKGQGKTAFDKWVFPDYAEPKITGQRYGVYVNEKGSYLDIPKIVFDAYQPTNGRVDDKRASQEGDRADQVAKAAIEKAMAGEAPSADAVIKKLNAPISGGDDDISFFDDEDEAETPADVVKPTPTPTPTPEAKSETKTEPTKTEEPELPADETVPARPAKEPNRVVEKIDPESLDELGTPESYEKYFGFVPSLEQTRILNSIVKAKKNTAVRAGAGAGKTTTLIGTTKALMELEPEARIALIQFNRINADEAAALAPKNTIANTTDAFFGTPYLATLGSAMRDRYLSDQSWHLFSPKQLADFFQFEDVYINGENANPAEVAALVKKAVSNYSYSTDEKIGLHHFNFESFGEGGNDNLKPESVEKLLKYANAYWKDLTTIPEWGQVKKKDGSIGKAVIAGKTVISPEHAIKMWALSKPDLSKLRSTDNKPITHLFLDEAQDTNAVLAKVINDNIDAGTAPIVVMVGDRSQTIYSFRGTDDAISTYAEGRAESVTGLTTTRRFGEELTTVANGFLNLIGEDYRLKSEIEGGEFFETTDLDEIPDGIGKTTVLTRTNGAAFTEMAKYLAEGRVVGVSVIVKKELESAISNLDWLLSDFSTRPKQPPITNSDFTGMKSRKDLQLAAKVDPQSRAAYWERLLSFSSSPEEAIKGLQSIVDKVVVDREQVDEKTITNLDAKSGNSGSFKGMNWSVEGDTLILKDEQKNAIFQTPTGYNKTFRQLVIGDKKGSGRNAEKVPPVIRFPDGSIPEWRAKLVNGEWQSQIIISSDAERTQYLNQIAGLFEADSKEVASIDVRVSTAHRYKGKEDDNIIIADDFKQPKPDENGNIILPSEDELNLAYVAVTRAKKRLNLGSLAYGREFMGKDGLARANEMLRRDPNFGMDLLDKEEAAQKAIRDKRNSKKSAALKTLSSTGYNGDVYFSDDEMDEPQVTSTSMKAPGGGKKFTDNWGVTQKGFSKRIDGTTWNITENKDGSVVVRPRTNEDRVSARKYNSMDEAAKDFPSFQKDARSANVDKLIETIAPLDTDGSISKVIKENGAPEDILKAIVSSDRYGEAVDNGEINFLSLYAALDNAGTSGLSRPKTAKPKDLTPPKFIDTTEKSVDLYNNNPNSQDDGSDVDVIETGGPEIERTKTKGDILGMLTKLMEFGGKVQRDGSVVMFRRMFDEETGPAAGKQRILEVRAVGNRSASASVIWKVTDPETNTVIGEFYDRDTSDSFQALLGIMRKKLDSGFMRDLQANPMSENPARNFERIRDTSGIEGSIRYFRKGNFNNILRNKKESTSNLKLQTPEEHAMLQLNGRDLRLNGSAEKWFIANNKGVESVFDAIDRNNMQAAAALFQQYLLNIPDTKKAHDVAKNVLRQGMRRKFPDMDARKLESILDDMSDKVDSALPKPGTVIRPHVDRNGAPVVEGSIVRWENNVGEFVQGKVVELIGYENPDGGAYTYADYALVIFDGRKKPVNLNTQNMEVLPDASEDDITPYLPWVEKDDLKIERAKFYGYTYDPRTGLITDKGGTVIDRTSDMLDLPVNKFSTNTVKKPVKDLQPGDAIYDDEGNLYGKVKQVKVGKNKEGQEVVGVRLEDNDKPLFFDPEEDANVEAPKGANNLPKSETPGPLTPAAEKAKALGLNFTTGGKPSKKKISRNPNKLDPEINSKIRGSKRVAIKPTPEARAIKDEILDIGSDLQKQAEMRLAEKLRERGVEIDPNNPFEEQTTSALSKAVDGAYADLTIAQLQMNDYESERSIDPAGEEYANLFEQMIADGFASKTSVDKKALAEALREGGLDLLSYMIKPEDAKKGKSGYLAYAYKTLKSENVSEAADIYKAYEDRKQAHLNARDDRAAERNLLKELQAEATLEVLKENGVKFDSVSFNDFEGRILTTKGKYPLRPNSTFKAAVALQEAFDRMPEATIRRLADHLKATGKKLYVQAGVKRGSFGGTSGGDYQLNLSAAYGINGISKHTDTALHELQHFLEAVDDNVRTVGHAWAYDRLVRNPGTDKEFLPNIVSIPNGPKGELGFALPGLAAPYMLKSYEKGDFFLTPNSVGSEVTSVLMQDMFTSPGFASMPNGQYVINWSMQPIEKGPNAGQLRKKYDIHYDAYYDEETESWYKNEQKTDKIENVASFFGRAKRDGLDRDVKNLGMGLIMMMNDWSPTEGFGPGNAVVTKD